MRNEAILVVDDEEGILTMLENLLRKEGYIHVTKASSTAEALMAVRTTRFDIIVLDVMLPDMDGFSLCMELRKTIRTPILFLSARSSDLDKLQGLYLGGDDYVTKPFNPMEVIARIQAHLRRSTLYASDVVSAEDLYQYHTFSVNRTTGQLIVNNVDTPCPAKELELLLYFCKHPNQVFTAQQLYEQVWGTMVQGDEKTVVIHISRLRKKLEADPSNPKLIVTLRGIGYKFVPPTGG
ncbi:MULTISPECIES: response regulator transcription factor [unclassified Bacillus (in: firmicutes)]|uniref:response regulator transcription factor n=1 Tax=unclassified Bacillus (in: firmicutes) TaxID=185979 RepID=UPI0008E07C81|nr:MULTISPECIES: response regulator transcription factor [unclassified Bacillus (in: firmicutes)]SFI90213.1 DNA-binding response regulator, OmpR family, contains REC and winged-helix (wHTH) domain [Bacillus sp. 71mf]SFS66483.1 DNA-binding response regulator, OmpR family, contains REC and winged-helix (wHTH) domain [Bacillus sp. 103mf]